MEGKTVLFGLIVLVGCLVITETKVYKRCELARELADKYKFDRSLLPHWICLVEHESGYDTTKVNHYPPSISGSMYRSFGLFQINNQTYCSRTSHGGRCDIKCEDLIKGTDIRKSVECAQKVFNDNGFKAWYKWVEKCKPKKPEQLPSLNECFRPQKRSFEIDDMPEDIMEDINLSDIFY